MSHDLQARAGADQVASMRAEAERCRLRARALDLTKPENGMEALELVFRAATLDANASRLERRTAEVRE